MARRFLSGKGVELEERNLWTHKEYREEFAKITNVMTVPVTVIGEKVIIGHNPRAFQSAIEAYTG